MDEDDFDTSDNQRLTADRSSDIYDSSTPKSSRRLRFPRFNRLNSNWRLPKIGLPRFRSGPVNVSDQRGEFLWFWLITIFISYIFIGYFLSVLLTIPVRKNLAIAGFITVALLPTITAFADYALVKWGYLISSILIVGGLIFVAKVPFHFAFLAFMAGLGITAIAIVGEFLIKQNRKFFVTIIILTLPCLLGLVAGWQIWQLVATKFS